MIPFDFAYYKPDTIGEALGIYKELDLKGKQPVYYAGGSEIISMARMHNIYTEAVIDIKGIPQLNVLEFRNSKLVIGAGVTLTRINESELFPLLKKAGGRIADHTMQDKITLGGNICGTIIYKETILPILLTEADVVIASYEGNRTIAFSDIYDNSLKLKKGEFIVQIIFDREYTDIPYIHVKKVKSEKIDYPLISLAAIKKDNYIRIALSGICSYPFRSAAIEGYINDSTKSIEQRVQLALDNLPSSILEDFISSASYRRFVLRNTLVDTLNTLEGMKNA